MLNIRTDQLEEFGGHLLARYKSELASFLTETYPEKFPEGISDEVSEFVESGISKAQNYGITTESEITEFTERMVTYSEDYDSSGEFPWIQKILQDPEIPGDEKMGHIALIELDESQS